MPIIKALLILLAIYILILLYILIRMAIDPKYRQKVQIEANRPRNRRQAKSNSHDYWYNKSIDDGKIMSPYERHKYAERQSDKELRKYIK